MSTSIKALHSDRGVADAPNATYAFTIAFFEELSRSGIAHVCVSPGSRSTPLAVSAASVRGLRIWSHLDERSSAFFAIGLAKASRSPVALVCTSGTALANYAPAVIEAHYAGVPLIILSADRPPELRDSGAGQTIDQVKIFGNQIRFFAELPIPEAGRKMLRFVRTIACRAARESLGTNPGPVHLNWPLREPLEPYFSQDRHDWAEGDAIAERGRDSGLPYVLAESEIARASATTIEALANRFTETERGIIACGVMDEPQFVNAVTKLADLLGWPLLAEPTSGLRTGKHIGSSMTSPIVAGSDLFLRDLGFRSKHRPAIVLRFGMTPVSKAFRLWIEASRPEELILVSSNSQVNEPSFLTSQFVRSDPKLFCEDLCEKLTLPETSQRRSPWLASFLHAEAQTQSVLKSRLDSTENVDPELLEPRATRILCKEIPDGSLLYVSNSMPIRNLDAFMTAETKTVRILSNRGANGIDGMISSALGAAAAVHDHVFLLTGDLAFLYDIGGLLAAQRYALRATIVVLNNAGGGIFSFLPISEYGDAVQFEELFTTPHNANLSAAAKLYDLFHVRVASWTGYIDALRKSLTHSGVTIIEVPIDRESNVQHFRALVQEIGTATSPIGDGA